MNSKIRTIQTIALAGALLSLTAQAGGPLYMFNETTPFAWDVTTPVQAYTDLGDLCDTDPNWPNSGCLTNEQADAAVAFAFSQWTAVSSSSFQAEVAGDFSSIGLGDITGANAHEIVDTWNGGGYHVMYDSDSSIIQDFFGAPPNVLGISSPEWADDDGNITESWAVINVASVPEGDDGTQAAGVMTHEFGHGINLAHSQANGHITFLGSPWYWISWAPQSCGAPYNIDPILDYNEYIEWIASTVIPGTETMYPYITPDQTGQAQSTVDRPDDITAVSNLYPAAGWPASHGSITGEILLKDGSTGLTGVNVVARNIADPLGDVVTVMSGDHTQGMFGPDGRYTINGLTPGADYVVYVENIYAGGFPTPPAALPSFQEYFNGTDESGDANRDNPCDWTPLTATAGNEIRADIAFNGMSGAPTFITIPVSSATDVDNSGQVVVGTYSGTIGWRYDTRKGSFDLFDSSSSPKLARNGHTMIGSMPPEVPTWEGGMYKPGFWSHIHGWEFMDMPETEAGCDGVIFSPYDLTSRGDVVVGLAYQDGCSRPPYDPNWNYDPSYANPFYAGMWTEETGLVYMETPREILLDKPNCSWPRETGCDVRGTRANAISGDGRTVVGHVDAAGWKGAAWFDGEFTLIGQDDPKGWVGSVNAVTPDGQFMIGSEAGSDEWGQGIGAYIWSAESGTRNLGHTSLLCTDVYTAEECANPWMPVTFELPATAFALSDDGRIVLGRSGSPWDGFVGWIWMEELGMVDFNDFLQGQGIIEAYLNGLIGALAISGDGKTIVGWGLGPSDQMSFAVTLDQVWVCRKGKSSLAGFPNAMLKQLDNGATLGLCQQDRVIAPQ